MKKLLFLLILLCLEKSLHAQTPYIYTIKADSVKITNTCDTAELIIENHTQNVPGFLFNKGRGRTEFRRVAQFDDTTVAIGGDTIHLARGNKNFANADLTFTGDRFHNGAFRSMKLFDFGEIGFKANTMDGTFGTEMKMDTLEGFNIAVNNTNNPNVSYSTNHIMKQEYITMGSGMFRPETNFQESSGLTLVNNSFGLSSGTVSLETFEGESVGIRGEVPHDGPRELDIYAENGEIILHTDNTQTGKRIEIQFFATDSLRFVNSGGVKQSQFSQTDSSFLFKHSSGKLNFRLINLPASSNSTDSMLVVDNDGFVKKRPQSPVRKSATITASTYTVPADIDVVFVNYTGGTATITLPSGTLDREITIKNLNTTNSVALSGLDASESNTVVTRGAITVKYTGSAWVGISKY